MRDAEFTIRSTETSHARGRHRSGQCRGHAGARPLLQELGRQESYALWTVANSIEPWQPQPTSQPQLWSYRAMRPLVLQGARPRQPGEGRPPRHRAGESRPQGHLGLRRLALLRPAGDEARRVRHRAQSCVVGAALRHRRQGRLHGGRRPQDGSRRRRFRHHAERHLARSRCRVRRRGHDLAGRPRHAAGQPARRQLLCRASRPRAEVELSAQRHRAGLRRPGPAAGRRRSLEQAVLAAAQVRMGAAPTRRWSRPPRRPTARPTTAS